MRDTQSFEDARRGLIEAQGERVIMGAGARPDWSRRDYEFLGRTGDRALEVCFAQ
jgi:alkyl sulfatase BDS1-like metallo-beta-lactamase superfamily hydrolase